MRLADLMLRLRALLFRKQVEQDLQTELDLHLDMLVRKNLSQGMNLDEARRQAMIKFGSSSNLAEACRDERRLNLIDSLFSDVRYALRQFRRAPGFVAVAVLSLALGIGANTAIFTAIDALLLKMLPVEDPPQLVFFRTWASFPGNGNWILGLPSFAAFEQLRDHATSFSDMAAIYNENAFFHGAQSHIAVVSGTYFRTLGVRAAAGRTFTTEEDDGRGNHPVAVISHAFGLRHYGLEADALGQTVALKGTTYTIVGVMPSGFSGDRVGTSIDVWFPMTMIAQVMSDRAALVSNPSSVQVNAIARLKDDVSLEQATAELEVLYPQLFPERNANPVAAERKQPSIRLDSHAYGYSWQREYYAGPLEILAVVIGAVLLIACANVSNLLLARSAARQKETAVRLAIGAGRLRILRQHLTESMLLALLAGGLGLVLAFAGTGILGNFVANGPFAVELNLSPDWRVITFAVAVSVLTGLLFGVAPALGASRMSLLKVSGTPADNTVGKRRPGRVGVRQLLVITQVALSIFLLVTAGLFVRTFRNLKFQDLGYDGENILLLTSDRLFALDGKAVARAYQEVPEQIRAIPGVLSVAAASNGLLTGGGFGLNPVTVPGHIRKPNEETGAGWNDVAPGYFKAIGMRFAAGRDFTDSDTAGSPRVAIINETMARHYFGRPDPIGSRFGVRRDVGNEIEIIGVVKDAKYNLVREEKRHMIFFPYTQEVDRLRAINLAIRTNGDVPNLPSRVKEIVARVSPDFPIVSMEWMDGQLDRSLMPERLTASLSGLFALLAALLACIGLYGVVSYTVARRTKELGLRVAMGAQRSNVLAMVIKESIALVLVGIFIGLPAAFATANLVASQLYGVQPIDPATTIAAIAMMLVSSISAAWIPARRAANTDPITALRYE